MQSVQSLSHQLPAKLFAMLVDRYRGTDPYDIEAIARIVDEYLEGERLGGELASDNETKRIA